MATPVIITVDDEPTVLNAVERDLRNHLRNTYRIVKARSGREALDAVSRLRQRNVPVALFLADQRMPEMTGVQFLQEAMRFYPDAKKVLLTAYSDSEAAIASINAVGLDYYLIKPWQPPEERLYPVIDDLLGDWQATVPQPFEGIRVAGALWSGASHNVKDFLARNRIPFQWLDVERSQEARLLVESVGDGTTARLPVVFFPDGEILIAPSLRELADKSGLQTRASLPFYDVIIIGAGPAGLGAGVYAASEGLRAAIVEKEATGGQAGTSSRIENYLGFPAGISGADLAHRATAQAKRFGAEILTGQEVVKVHADGPTRIVTMADGSELGAHVVVIATGVSVRELDVPGVKKLTGAGIYYGAAATEAANYKGRDVVVVGGANSAGQGAMYLSRFASCVKVLVRETIQKSMSNYLCEQIASTENIEVLTGVEVQSVSGEDRLQEITIHNLGSGEVSVIPAAAMFVFIGAAPRTDMVAGEVVRDEAGFIFTGPDLLIEGRHAKGWKLEREPYLLETSVPGIFAVGDVRHGAMRRVASAVGEGALTISLVHRYLASG